MSKSLTGTDIAVSFWALSFDEDIEILCESPGHEESEGGCTAGMFAEFVCMVRHPSDMTHKDWVGVPVCRTRAEFIVQGQNEHAHCSVCGKAGRVRDILRIEGTL